MKASSFSAASTITYDSDTSHPLTHLNDHGKSSEEARLFDILLKKLETVRIKARGRSANDVDHRPVSRQERDDFISVYDDNRRDSSIRDSIEEDDSEYTSRELQYRVYGRLPVQKVPQHDSAMTEKQRIENTFLYGTITAEHNIRHLFYEEKLPQAILRLDRRYVIPKPMQQNDVLVEIEACTIEKRSLSNRPGIRSSLHPTPIETIAVDCVGRVVQLTTHTRAIHGLGLEDRVAALYPFEYCDNDSKMGCGGGVIGRKRKGLGRYALVDAGYVVTVPKCVESAQAVCLIRLYMTVFQSIELGIFHTVLTHDRYDISQLSGKSLLIENGHTELGLAAIELAIALGANQIFATGPSEYHSIIRDAGATPLGKETFRWELFLTEKLSMVLLQDMPSPDNFHHFLRILDDETGVMVKIDCWAHQQYEEENDSNGISDKDVGCEMSEVIENARYAFDEAKFHLQRACCSQFLTYDGVWASLKAEPLTWKEDLRFLLAVLGERKLNPRIYEKVCCVEDVPDVQDKIELYGKTVSIMCLPSKMATERSGARNGSVKYSSQPKDLVQYDQTIGSCAEKTPQETTSNIGNMHYAIDSGYVRSSQLPSLDTLSDFHHMSDMTRSRKERSFRVENHLPLMLNRNSPSREKAMDAFGMDYAFDNSESSEYMPYHSSPIISNSKNETMDSIKGAEVPLSQRESKISRRNRIIRRLKIQQHHNNTHESARKESTEVEDVNNTKFHRRNLRKDARTKGSPVKRSNLGLPKKAVFSADNNAQVVVSVETKQSSCHDGTHQEEQVTDNFVNEVVNNTHKYEGTMKVTNSMRFDKERLMQQDSSTSHIRPDPWLIKVTPEKKNDNVRTEDNQLENEENPSSFYSIMNQWKRIEESNLK